MIITRAVVSSGFSFLLKGDNIKLFVYQETFFLHYLPLLPHKYDIMGLLLILWD